MEMKTWLAFCSETTPLLLAVPVLSSEESSTLFLQLQTMENAIDLLNGPIIGLMIY